MRCEFDRWMNPVRIRIMSEEDEFTLESTLELEGEEEPEKPVKPRVILSGKDAKFLNDALIRFTSCGRCSLFLAAYRLIHDDGELLAAVRFVENDWLSLPWDGDVRELLLKSYGVRIDVESYYFESCCPECKSPFIYSEEEDGSHRFLMSI